ncbi:hypothetical protein Q4I30_000929 [Leishmania utingensis]|uniref:Uncharacterized protein n=1 Tax=Leishmania utingensis TaxID=653362 RepID=A0AAW3B028_9TRYP
MHQSNEGAQPLPGSTTTPSPPGAPLGVRAGEAADHKSAQKTEALPLADLLIRASDAIRSERGRADSMEKENNKLRAQLEGVRSAYQSVATQRAQRSSQTLASVTTYNKAVEDTLFAYGRDQLIGPDDNYTSGNNGGNCTTKSNSRTRPRQSQWSSSAATSSVASVAARTPPRGSITPWAQSWTKGWDAQITPPEPAPQRTAEHNASTAAKKCVQRVYSSAALRHRALKTGNDHLTSSLTGDGSCKGQGSAALEGYNNADESRTHWMARRLLRALAPRPTDSTVGDIVHTMVTALQQDVQAELDRPRECSNPVQRRPRGFALVRLQPCVYRLLVGPPAEVKAKAHAARVHNSGACPTTARLPSAAPYRDHFLLYSTNQGTPTASRTCHSHVTNTVIRLTIDTGTLRVLRGGGHIDFIDYLEHHLHIKLYNGRRTSTQRSMSPPTHRRLQPLPHKPLPSTVYTNLTATHLL